jgi:beta-glucosidase/6-phospho-beta-glucosidase/beta-galactosidase
VAVTEFGFSEPFESSKTLLQDILYDTVRTSYYHDYMQAILLAIAEGTDVVGCLAWSFVDNYVSTRLLSFEFVIQRIDADGFDLQEWQQGYKSRFGLQFVNFTDPAVSRRYF